MTLSDILGRGVSMEWYEGVALVRAVATSLLATSSEASIRAPELHQIEISDIGDVRVTGGTIIGESVRHLGQLLQATLGHTDVPVQLRLVIVQATAPAPPFASIREFDEALAYFERPDRARVLQALYVRAAAAPLSGFVLPPTLDTVAPLPAADKPAAAPQRTTSKRKAGALRIAAVVLLVSVAATWYIARRGIAAGSRDASAIARQVSDAVGAATLSGLSAVTERAGLGRLVPADKVRAKISALRETPTAKASGRKTTPAPPHSPAMPIVMFDLATPRDRATESSLANEESAASSGVAADVTEDRGRTVFSAGSNGVTPPVDVRQQLPRELPPNIRREQLAHVELIVSEAGTVESVKLMGHPRSVRDSMFLSAVKAWHFHPAMKDGRPVRFRKTIWILAD
ncbi:MAG TPA: hypothetical protein VKE96_33175 [Vicinamibacterales bacterium]|nr:hypothetical protein [Vicinamibacterales bacterium]